MRRLFALLFGMLLGGVLVFLGFNFHLVRSDDGWLLVRKKQVMLTDFYADVRNWDTATWQQHPELSEALVADGRGNIVKRFPISKGMLQDLLQLRRSDGASLPNDDVRRE